MYVYIYIYLSLSLSLYIYIYVYIMIFIYILYIYIYNYMSALNQKSASLLKDQLVFLCVPIGIAQSIHIHFDLLTFFGRS